MTSSIRLIGGQCAATTRAGNCLQQLENERLFAVNFLAKGVVFFGPSMQIRTTA
jgi:hypothetical protein